MQILRQLSKQGSSQSGVSEMASSQIDVADVLTQYHPRLEQSLETFYAALFIVV